VKRESADYLERGVRALASAKAIAQIGEHRVAAREAYLAAFHAAEAYIFEYAGKTSKTHRGVRALFNQLAKGDPRIPPACAGFLAEGYDLKSIADYGGGPFGAVISEDDSTEAIAAADSMIRVITERLA
jgi:uncharacterized protein (UPF0332 family)